MFANVSEIASYVVCPRLCYFRMRDKIYPTEIHAVREIYLSKRKGFNESWAFERFKELFESDLDIFDNALKKFKFSEELSKLNPIDWEIKLKSEKLKLKGILDELVDFNGYKLPLVVSLRSPSKDVWFKDRIKITAFCMLLKHNGLECSRGYVYYCFDGQLRKVSVERKDKYYVLKLIERVLRLKNGFVPEKPKKAKCDGCRYKEVCDNKPSTFASRFF
jgi:CRISPR-associated exonuclease Cas4